MATLKPSLLAPAAAGELPVRWAVLRYETPPDEKPAFVSVAWWGNMALTPHAPELLQLRRIDAELAFGAEPLSGSNRKELAKGLHERDGGQVPAHGLARRRRKPSETSSAAPRIPRN